MRWKRIIASIFAGLAILLVVAAIGGDFYLKSGSFQRFAIGKIAAEAYRATGARTEIGAVKVDLWTLTVKLYDITVHGTEAPARPPLLHADRLTVRLKILSILNHQLALRELLLLNPVAHVEVSRDGKSNLPATPRQASSAHPDIFDLGIEHARLVNGEVFYNDQNIPVAADLYDLGIEIHSGASAKHYAGSLSYKNGNVRYAEYSPLPHDLNLKFTATPEQTQIRQAVLKIGSSSLLVEGQISNYSNPIADGQYRILLHTQDFGQFAGDLRPAGDVSLVGHLHYQRLGDDPLLRDISVDGQLKSGVLAATASGRRLDLARLQGTYRLAGGDLQLRNFSVDSMGGRIMAEAAMNHVDASPNSSVRASLSRLSLCDLQRIVGRQARPVSVSGTVGGTIEASWTGKLIDLRATSDLIVNGVAGSPVAGSTEEVPVSGAIHVSYDGPRQSVSLRDTVLKIPSASLIAQGTISKNSRLRVAIVADDLHHLTSLASSFLQAQQPLPAISGSANVNAVVQGAVRNPSITAQVDAENLAIESSEWKSAKLTVQASSSKITIEHATLINAHQGRATLEASVGLHNWSYRDVSPIRAHLEVQKLQVTDLEALARRHYPIRGDLSANVTMRGSQLQPSGSGTLQIAKAEVHGEPLRSASADFHAENGSIQSTLHISSDAGTVTGDVSYTPKTKAYSLGIVAPSLVLEKLRTVQERDLGLTGTMKLTASGRGTLDNPELTASVQLPRVEIRRTVISAFDAEIRVEQDRAELNLSSRVAEAPIHAQASLSLTGDYEANAVVDTGTIPLSSLLAAYSPGIPEGFQGQGEVHATLHGPLKEKSKIEAHLTLPVLRASYQSLNLGISQPLRLDYANSVLTLQPAEILGTDTSLHAQGRIPVDGPSSPTFTAQGKIDARVLQILDPTLQSSGVVAVDVRSEGMAIKGRLQLEDVAMTTEEAPIGVEKLNGTVDIANDHLQIANMTAQVGGGPVSLGGSVTYRPKLQFNLTMQGRSMRLLYPAGLRSSLDANLTFNGTMQSSLLSGRVLINSMSFTPDFDLSTFAGQFDTGAILSQPGFADTVKLAIRLQSQQNLSAVSSQVSIAGQVALQVGGTAGNPVITGRATFTSGELFYRNVRYQLQRGVITFDNPNETQPVLNVTVTTLIEQYNLTLTLRGPLNKLTTSYASDPSLATADIINLIARGQTTEEQAAASQSTDSMIASQVASQLTGSIQKLAGISSLQIDPTLGGNQNPSARVTIQQRVSKNFLFSFSTDVTEPGSEIVQGDYRINKQWSVTVQRDQIGGISIDGRYHTQF
ncbi:MAG TPA: translocation/assembly module TamB domain-containing protein [Candidatus Acidoferrales bacterium]|nr:translocation/assembly module TamB domain-containing protein [Candidatus Acidoferrales bacterium]